MLINCTAKLLEQGYRYHKLRKAFSKLYRRHYELISKFNIGLKSLLSIIFRPISMNLFLFFKKRHFSCLIVNDLPKSLFRLCACLYTTPVHKKFCVIIANTQLLCICLPKLTSCVQQAVITTEKIAKQRIVRKSHLKYINYMKRDVHEIFLRVTWFPP